MEEREQLQWIQQNRAKRTRTRSVGDAVVRLVEALAANRRELSQATASAIDAAVDDEFRSHCRVSRDRGGGLVVEVDDPAYLYLMRMKWWGPLSDAVVQAGSRVATDRIIFRAATT